MRVSGSAVVARLLGAGRQVNPVSCERTRQQLAWQPTHPDVIEDLDHDHYFQR